QFLRTIDAGATINDMLLTTVYLYVATSNGIRQYDLLNRSNPARTSPTFTTSSPNVRSLTIIGPNLYAADGDATVEVFNISIASLVQAVPPINSLATSTTVKTSNGKLYVSDANAQQTDVFAVTATSATRLATLSIGASSMAALSGDVAFAAGRDRNVRAYDFTTATTPVELFRGELSPTGGTI